MRHICGIFKNNTSTEFKIRKLKLIKDTIIPQQNITKQYLNIQNIYIYIHIMNISIISKSKVRSAV